MKSLVPCLFWREGKHLLAGQKLKEKNRIPGMERNRVTEGVGANLDRSPTNRYALVTKRRCECSLALGVRLARTLGGIMSLQTSSKQTLFATCLKAEKQRRGYSCI